MGFFSSTVSVSRYRVEGSIETEVIERVREGLTRHAIDDIDNAAEERAVGWTCIDQPFTPGFEDSRFIIGDFFLFSLRIDKKTIPSKVVKKQLAVETARRLQETGRDFLSRTEKRQLKDHVLNVLSLRIPPTPNVYDVYWHYEDRELWFFSTQKAANEELESLFAQSFDLTLVRLFPYTLAELGCDLSHAERDALATLTPSRFSE